MIVKKYITHAALVGMMALSTSTAFAQDKSKALSDFNLKRAEKSFQTLCNEDNHNSYAECKCVAKVLKEELPSKHYNVLMDLVDHGYADERGEINLEDEDVEKILDRHDVSFFTVMNFTFQILSATDELRKCDIDEDKFKIIF